MNFTNVEIVFEGSGVREGTINARLLADALAGCSDILTRSNQIANGEASEAVVLVQSDFKRGSFIVDVQLVQEVVEHARQLITAHPFLSAGSLAGVIGFVSKNKDTLIELFKWLKGKKPDKVTPAGNNSIEITFGQNKDLMPARLSTTSSDVRRNGFTNHLFANLWKLKSGKALNAR